MKWLKKTGDILLQVLKIIGLIAISILGYNLIWGRGNKAKIHDLTKKADDDLERAKEVKENIKDNDDKRKSTRDKYSTTLILLLVLSFVIPCNAKYIVWDKEDKVYRDYGNITNYVKSLEEEKEIFISTQKSNDKIIMLTERAVTNYKIAYKEKECEPSFWEKIDFYVGMALPPIMYALKLLFF